MFIKLTSIKQKQSKTNLLKQPNFGMQNNLYLQLYILDITTIVGCPFSFLGDIKPSSQPLLEKVGQIMDNDFRTLVNQVVAEAFESMKPGTPLQLRMVYSQIFNWFILDVIDITTKKIIAYVILDKG